MTLTMEGVLALAPDEASAKAARGLIAPAKWPVLGANDAAVWGECQGSGATPYRVCGAVDDLLAHQIGQRHFSGRHQAIPACVVRG